MDEFSSAKILVKVLVNSGQNLRLKVENLNSRSTKTDQFDFSVSNIILSGRVSLRSRNIETLFTSIGKSTFATGKFCGHKVFN